MDIRFPQDAIAFPSVVILYSPDEPIHLTVIHALVVMGEKVPPFFLTPRRFPAESWEPALKLPDRFVAVRTPRGSVGLRIIWGRAVGTVARALRKDSVGRTVITVVWGGDVCEAKGRKQIFRVQPLFHLTTLLML